ncbi:MAG TPA: LptA/OstA family protein [Opitutaceae bacterium]|nr:LptA/OstA family protein [Opitutaceae bacterium]
MSAALSLNGADVTNTTIMSKGSSTIVSASKDETTITFEDEVVVTGTNLILTCDKLEAVVFRKGSASALLTESNKFKTLIATGHVHIVQGVREANCGQAQVLPLEDKIVLTEDPVVRDSALDVTWEAFRITILRGQQKVIAEPWADKRLKVTGPGIKDLGFDPKKDAPPAAPGPKPETSK